MVTLLIIALFFVFVRTVIRFRYQKQFFLDDVVLYFGVICLCVAVGLLLQFSEAMYAAEDYVITSASGYNRWSELARFQKNSDAYMALTYTTLFLVKFSFLLFFRILVRRVRKMIIYWWTVLAIMIVAWPVSIVAAVAPSCPIFDITSSMTNLIFHFFLRHMKLMHITVTCLYPFDFRKIAGLAALATILDIATDILR